MDENFQLRIVAYVDDERCDTRYRNLTTAQLNAMWNFLSDNGFDENITSEHFSE